MTETWNIAPAAPCHHSEYTARYRRDSSIEEDGLLHSPTTPPSVDVPPSPLVSSSSTPATDPFLFRCKTNDANTIKVLLELLHNNIKTGCFEISSRGIYLCMTDSNRRTLLHLSLESRQFNYFYVKSPHTPLNIGVNLIYTYKMLKTVKKKDSLQLFIRENAPSDLGIQIVPKDNGRLMTSYVRIQTIQHLDIQAPEPYFHSILISSSEFSKMCKDMLSISSTMTIMMTQYNIHFSCLLGSVYSREVILGETMMDDTLGSSSIFPTQSTPLFKDEFDTEQLSRIFKIAGLSSTINIHTAENMPLLIECKVGNLGKISIYVKSRQQMQQQAENGQ